MMISGLFRESQQQIREKNMPRKYYYLIETIVGLALVVLIDHFFVPGSSGFINVTPHPYWIVILLIACRYGTIQGLFAGMTAAITYYLLASLSPDVNFKNFTFPHGPFKLPFFFILVGGVLGEIRNIHKKLSDKLQDKFDDTVKDLDSLAVEHTALSNSKTELEKRIALQSSTMLNLFERLINIEQLAPEELFRKIPELLKEQLNAACSSVYLLKDNKLR